MSQHDERATLALVARAIAIADLQSRLSVAELENQKLRKQAEGQCDICGQELGDAYCLTCVETEKRRERAKAQDRYAENTNIACDRVEQAEARTEHVERERDTLKEANIALQERLDRNLETAKARLIKYGQHKEGCTTKLCVYCNHPAWVHDHVEDIDMVTCAQVFTPRTDCDCGLSALLGGWT